MSYIRALSNPEGLYIIGTRDGQVEFLGVPDWGGKQRSDVFLRLPRSVFHGVLRKWFDAGFENVHYRGAAMVELGYSRLGLHVDFTKPETWKNAQHPDLHKFRLTYPEKWGAEGVNAWTVTWHYITCNIMGRR